MIVLVRPGEIGVEEILELEPEEAHHLRVRRAEPGEHLGLRNGSGLVGTGILLEAGAKRALVRVDGASQLERPPALALLVAAGDKDRFGWLAEKCAELGVSSLTPLETERTSGVASRVGPSQLARLSRRALEATKQSGAAWAPEVLGPAPFADVIGRGADGARWLADPAGARPADPGAREGITVLVGPEGGLTASEHTAAVAAGWVPIRLGPGVLRFETAAIAAAAYAGIAREGTAHD